MGGRGRDSHETVGERGDCRSNRHLRSERRKTKRSRTQSADVEKERKNQDKCEKLMSEGG